MKKLPNIMKTLSMFHSSSVLKLVHKRTWNSMATLFLGSQRSGMQNYCSSRSLREICFESSTKPSALTSHILQDLQWYFDQLKYCTGIHPQYVPYKTSSARSWDMIKGQNKFLVSDPPTTVGGISLIRVVQP